MKDLSKLLRVAISGLFIASFSFQNTTLYARDSQNVNQMTIYEVTDYLSRTWRDNQPLVSQIFSKAETNPEFRKNLIDSLKKRYEAESIRIRSSNLTRAFRYLNATEFLPQLMKKWNETEKKVENLEFADLRIQLLITITNFLPESESIDFLIKTESDTTEAPVARFRAAILLFETGNKKAIEYLLEAYEKAKHEFPAALQDKNPPLAITEADSDGDLISDANEIALQLDPKNPDTDGDGLNDGNDRNPLCKPMEGKLSEDQEIANFIMYFYSRYKIKGGPYESKEIVIRTVGVYDDETKPSLAANVEFTGIDNVILHMNQQQLEKYRADNKAVSPTLSLYKTNKEEENVKEFSLSLYTGPMGGERHRITFKKIDNVWLLTSWQLAGMA